MTQVFQKSNTPIQVAAIVDQDALGKLMLFAKRLAEIVQAGADKRRIEQVLLRTQEGELSFQVKRGTLWRFFNITLMGRENEYDLAQNVQNVQKLFLQLEGLDEDEIRRAASGIVMYNDVIVATDDAVRDLRRLQETLNSILEHVKVKKIAKESSKELKSQIASAFERMMIRWTTSTRHASEAVEDDAQKFSKRNTKRVSKITPLIKAS